MTLSKILEGVRVSKMFQTLYGQMVATHEVQIHQICYDSRKVVRGDLFVAIHGTQSDGHQYIDTAIQNGAKVVVLDNETAHPDPYFMHLGVVKIVVPDSRMALAQMSANFFSNPSAGMTMIGVTGTNGKTTTSTLIKAVLESSGRQAGLIGTIEYLIGNERYPATHTTPESLELQELFSKMTEKKCDAAVMEVSSHALEQHRTDGIHFQAAVFTNLTQDHLDYHLTMDNYFAAKSILFKNLSPESWAIINIDDPYGVKLLDQTPARVITYGTSGIPNIKAENISLSMKGITMEIVHGGERIPITTPLMGRFNVSNILAAFGVGIALGIDKKIIRQAFEQGTRVNGRFEPILTPDGRTVIIDYAHTPDALQKTLSSITDIFGKQSGHNIITVFGCGGNRDKTKRPRMGKIVSELSDITIITSDNPRNEEPEQIIRDVIAGIVPERTVLIEPDREKAILMALEQSKPGDVVLVAGKGHEDYQIIGSKKIHFSDREIIEMYFKRQA